MNNKMSALCGLAAPSPLHAQGRRIEGDSPFLGDSPGVTQAQEPVLVQAFNRDPLAKTSSQVGPRLSSPA